MEHPIDLHPKLSPMFKKIAVPFTGLLALLYLIYPSLGIFELIPDAIPVIGNLDEAAAVALLLSVLRYYGLDLANLFKRDKTASESGERQELSTGN